MIEVDKMGITMLKKFVKYVSQNMLGMVGMSVYILADTYFISVAVGTDGITALNLVLPVYNMIFANSKAGYGQAAAIVMTVILLIVSFLVSKFFSTKEMV